MACHGCAAIDRTMSVTGATTAALSIESCSSIALLVVPICPQNPHTSKVVGRLHLPVSALAAASFCLKPRWTQQLVAHRWSSDLELLTAVTQQQSASELLTGYSHLARRLGMPALNEACCPPRHRVRPGVLESKVPGSAQDKDLTNVVLQRCKRRMQDKREANGRSSC